MAEYQPSRDWKEVVAPNEAARHEAFAALLTSIQSKRRAKYGEGRALHRKGLLALPARLSVLPDLPDYCRYGLFAKPEDYEARIRLSNGGMDIQANGKPDIRGFAISVLGVSGPGALGGETARQDFLLINQDTFSSPTSQEFMTLVEAASRGQTAILTSFIRNFGLFGRRHRQAVSRVCGRAVQFRRADLMRPVRGARSPRPLPASLQGPRRCGRGHAVAPVERPGLL